jgi:hypothetical protein
MDGPEKSVPALSTVAPIKPDVNEKVVTALRHALKEAKEGKIQAIGIAICILDPGNQDGRATETVLSAADGWYHSLACAVAGLAFRLHYERYTQGSILADPKLEDTDE